MAITQEVFYDVLEKLADGNFKIKYPKVKSKSGLLYDDLAVDYVQFKNSKDKPDGLAMLGSDGKIKADNLDFEVSMIPSDNTRIASVITSHIQTTDWLKQKEFKIGNKGVVRVQVKTDRTSGTISTQIRVNGVNRGQPKNNSAGNVTYFEDITGIKKGDLIQVYGKLSAGATGYVEAVFLQYDLVTSSNSDEVTKH